MIKIIQQGLHVATCPECETKISFGDLDTIRERTGPCEETTYVVCPVCDTEIHEKDWRY